MKHFFLRLVLCLTTFSLTSLGLTKEAHAFEWVQLNKAGDTKTIRLGYHNENPDLFWRLSAGYSRHQNSDMTSVAGDWVIPIPGVLSTLFIGAQLEYTDEFRASARTGITLVKYLEFGWQSVPQSDDYALYGGVNIAF
ncbi:hypothetical protein ACQUQU_01245 [Thalassolituus sp. LLYu03]|uniref:hypothetical protein n=1 Tax=Thalassolituus sp. LLYu03 TaxID=3421656 RepID=UPI003D2E272D